MATPRMHLHRLHPHAAALRSSITRPSITTPLLARTLTTSPRALQENPGVMPDNLGDGKLKGATGGGDKLNASSKNAVPRPKISNLSVPGADPRKNMTEEQKREVDEHNRDFERKHEHGPNAPDDKVDKKFWSTERRQ